MDCRDAQEQIVEMLAECDPGTPAPEVEAHLAGCDACTAFWGAQTALDRELSSTIVAQPVNPRMRVGVRQAIRREPLTVWSDRLPDVAHLAGSVCAIGLCMILLPFPPATVAMSGVGLALVTLVLQLLIRDTLDGFGNDLL